MKREKSKLEKWIERYLKAELIGCSNGEESRYYKFNTRVLRISNHISVNNAHLSIIIDSHDSEHFLIHAVKTGEVSVLNYKEVKTLIKAIRLLPATINLANNTEIDCKLPEISQTISNSDEISLNCGSSKPPLIVKAKDAFVLGIPISKFSKGRQQTIVSLVRHTLKKK